MENYYLDEADGTTTLRVEVDTVENHAGSFREAFPKALKKVTELSESA